MIFFCLFEIIFFAFLGESHFCALMQGTKSKKSSESELLKLFFNRKYGLMAHKVCLENANRDLASRWQRDGNMMTRWQHDGNMAGTWWWQHVGYMMMATWRHDDTMATQEQHDGNMMATWWPLNGQSKATERSWSLLLFDSRQRTHHSLVCCSMRMETSSASEGMGSASKRIPSHGQESILLEGRGYVFSWKKEEMEMKKPL